MATFDPAVYVDFGNGSSTGYYAVTVRPQNTAVAAGVLRRQFTAPAVTQERVFICIIAGTTANTTDATWTVTYGAKVSDGTATWQECTGRAALNGDFTNSATWATGGAGFAWVLGQVIYDSTSGSVQICSTAGTAGGSVPTFSATAGVTTADNTATWTSCGPSSNFTGWQAPIARLITGPALGGVNTNTIFVASEHAETQTTAIAVAFQNKCRTICVNKTNVPPGSANVTTGATVTTTSTGTLGINCGAATSSASVTGLTFSCGSGATSAGLTLGTTGGIYFKNCNFIVAGNSGSQQIIMSGKGSVYDNCTVKFGTTTGNLVLGGGAPWKNTPSAIQGATIPTSLYSAATSAIVDGVDLGAFTGTLMLDASADCEVVFKNCKLNAGVTIAPGSITAAYNRVSIINCDSGATNYRNERYSGIGSVVTETTIVRTGGASDGVTPVSWKIVTASGASWDLPFDCVPIAIWNDTTGSNVTVTVYGIWGGGAVPNNDDIWMEVEYLGSSSTPQATFNYVTKANTLDTGSAQGSDSSTWGGSTTAFKMSVTLSSPQPGMKGPIYVTVKAGKPSTTFYIDPLIVLS